MFLRYDEWIIYSFPIFCPVLKYIKIDLFYVQGQYLNVYPSFLTRFKEF